MRVLEFRDNISAAVYVCHGRILHFDALGLFVLKVSSAGET